MTTTTKSARGELSSEERATREAQRKRKAAEKAALQAERKARAKAAREEARKRKVEAKKAAAEEKKRAEDQAKESELEAGISALVKAKKAGGPYPMRADELFSRAGTRENLKKYVIQSSAFATTVRTKTVKPTDLKTAWVTLADDEPTLLASAAVFLEALTAARKADHHLLSLSDLSKNVKASFKARFLNRWEKSARAGDLPEGVGCLSGKSGRNVSFKVFLLSDIRTAAPITRKEYSVTQPSSPQTGSPTSVKTRMLEEFDRLNEELGTQYYVTLFDLRQAMADVGRQVFDDAINDLRRDWVLTLNPAEGRHETVPRHVLEAGITEQSRLLVYAARRES